MKKIPFMILSIALLFVCCGCSDSKRTLSFYTWDDYIDPVLISEFETKNNCRVVVNVFDSNEAMYAKLLFSSKGYDLVLPTSYQIVIMKNNNMLEKLDMGLLPNVTSNFNPIYNTLLLDGIRGYSVPYAFSMTAIAYNKNKVKKPVTHWSDIDNMDISNKVCLFNDMREVIGAALKKSGYSGNSTNDAQLAKASETINKWKKVTTKFDNEAWKSGIAGGEFNVVMAYNSDIFQILSDIGGDSGIEFTIPEEGIMVCFDEFVILKGSENKDLAYKFIDFMYEPENAKRNIEYILAVMPNKAAVGLLSDDMSKNPMIVPTEDVLKKCEVINYIDTETHQKYVRIWDEMKSAPVE